MHIYLAAIYTNGYRAGGNSGRYQNLTDNEKRLVDAVPHILESYHYVGKQKFVDAMREDKVRVFLDSGAFSAYTLKVGCRILRVHQTQSRYHTCRRRNRNGIRT